MNHVLGLECVQCGARFGQRTRILPYQYVCDRHPGGILDVVYDYDMIAPQITKQSLKQNPGRSLWRYLPLLPLDPAPLEQLRGPMLSHPLFAAGWTPLYQAGALASLLDMRAVYVKDEGRNPSASFKDRASAVGIAKALEWKATVIAAASTGNAASSLATLSASLGIQTVIFVPQAAPKAKIAQLLIHGALVLAVQGTYDDAYDLCLEACQRFGWYSRNTGYNPYLSEGKKTAALEICEQLDWHVPDCILVPVGDGCIIGGLGKGLRDLYTLGMIEHMPRLIGVQAEGSAALHNAWAENQNKVQPVQADTFADSIAVNLPRDCDKALRAVRDTQGAFVQVSDDEIRDAMRVLARKAGVFGEPAGAASYAGLVKARQDGLISAEERAVVLVTGSGLKDVQGAMSAVAQAISVPPRLKAVENALQAQAPHLLHRR